MTLRERLGALLLPLACFTLWIGLCIGFKLLTWKPFAGDAAGSVATTYGLVFLGTVVTVRWMWIRWRR